MLAYAAYRTFQHLKLLWLQYAEHQRQRRLTAANAARQAAAAQQQQRTTTEAGTLCMRSQAYPSGCGVGHGQLHACPRVPGLPTVPPAWTPSGCALRCFLRRIPGPGLVLGQLYRKV